MIDRAEIMTQATQLRRELGKDTSAPIDIFTTARAIEGLTIVFYPMGEKLSGMCIRGKGKNFVVAINSSMSRGRQNFSLAHEFYHMYYDNSAVSLCGKRIGIGQELEKKADLFASFFLMPNDEFVKIATSFAKRNSNGKLTINDIVKIEQYFQVSHQATVIRLIESNYLTQKEANKYLEMSVKGVAESLGYNGDLYRSLPANKLYGTYGTYIEQADTLLQRGLISQGKYESLLLDAFRPDLVYGSDEDGDVID